MHGLTWRYLALVSPVGDAADMLERRRNDTSKSLREHMRGLGLNPDQLAEKVASREPLISLDHVAAFLETHIQQAGSLARLMLILEL